VGGGRAAGGGHLSFEDGDEVVVGCELSLDEMTETLSGGERREGGCDDVQGSARGLRRVKDKDRRRVEEEEEGKTDLLDKTRLSVTTTSYTPTSSRRCASPLSILRFFDEAFDVPTQPPNLRYVRHQVSSRDWYRAGLRKEIETTALQRLLPLPDGKIGSQKHGEEAHLIVFRKDELEGVERFFSFGWLEVRVVFDLGLVKGDEATVDALEEVQSISEEKRIGDSGRSWMEEGRERRDLSCCFDMSRRDETSNLDAVYRSEPSKSSRCQPCSSLCLS
jgi:hypothetical protein